MELGLYTDSVDKLSFDEALDLAARIGATGIEIAVGGQSPAPHLRIEELLADASARERFAENIHQERDRFPLIQPDRELIPCGTPRSQVVLR